MSEEPKSKSLEIGLAIFILLGLIASFFIWQDAKMRRKGRGHSYIESINNARQIGLALLEVDSDYGSYPNVITAAEITTNYPKHGYDLSGTSSNALFRQFFAAYITQSEQMFYARIPGTHKSSGNISPGHLLEPGENGFSYITGLTSYDDPATPLVLTPLIPGTTKFDPKSFNGKAIVLHIDNSVTTYEIQKDGHIYRDGIDLLSPKHPIWKGKAPDIRYPE